MEDPGTYTILIVEDEAMLALAIQKKLKAEGFNTVVVYNGDEAIKK